MDNTTKVKGKSGEAHGKSGAAKGQAKLITLVNATTGVTQDVIKSEFKANRAQYEADGFARLDDDDDTDEGAIA